MIATISADLADYERDKTTCTELNKLNANEGAAVDRINPISESRDCEVAWSA